MTKLLSLRVWIFIFILLFSIIAISPTPFAKGVQIKHMEEGSPEQKAGIKIGEIIKSVNGIPIKTIEDFNNEINKLKIQPTKIKLETSEGTFEYELETDDIGFISKNLTIVSVTRDDLPLKKDMKILKVNDSPVKDDSELSIKIRNLLPKIKFVIKTNKNEYALLLSSAPTLRVGEAKKTHLELGLDLQGGTRVLLQPKSNQTMPPNAIKDIIDVLQNRLNIYGLADLNIREANDLSGNKFILVEIAGVTKEEVRDLIAKQGVFEAKIGNEVVFRGGKGDIPFVCRDDGSCSGIKPPCNQANPDQWLCQFEFVIHLSPEAARRHSQVTKDIAINTTESGRQILSKNIDFYLDDKLVESLQIAADLKGQEATQILISGPGFGPTQEAAFSDALKEMKKLQTIIITGSLPYKLEIVKVDTLSPKLGETFIKNAFIMGIFATIAVALVLFIRYRNIRLALPIIINSLSEVIMVLGFASILKWNLDLSSIAGIIAAIGTGVDDLVVITDETLRGEGSEFLSWKERIKRALSIVFASWLTTTAAMAPLLWAGAGLIRGFAFTTIVGISIGVFITRPAFASIVEYIASKSP